VTREGLGDIFGTWAARQRFVKGQTIYGRCQRKKCSPFEAFGICCKKVKPLPPSERLERVHSEGGD
jgi:hypothetical protein